MYDKPESLFITDVLSDSIFYAFSSKKDTIQIKSFSHWNIIYWGVMMLFCDLRLSCLI